MRLKFSSVLVLLTLSGALAWPSSLGLGGRMRLRSLAQQPPVRPPPPSVTLQQLMSNVDVSADQSGVRVALPPVPRNGTDEPPLPPVVVRLFFLGGGSMRGWIYLVRDCTCALH